MEKRFLLALSLSLIVLFGYQYLLQRLYGTSLPPAAEPKHKQPQPISQDLSPLLEKPSQSVTFTTDRITLAVTEETAAISTISTNQLFDSKREEAELAKVEGYDNEIGYMWCITPKTEQLKFSKVEENTQNLSFLAETSQLRVKKSFLSGTTPFDLILEIEVTNISAQILPLYYGLVGPSSLLVSEGDRRFFDLLALSNGKVKKYNPQRIQKSPSEQKELPAAWLAMRNKYFSLVAKPQQRTNGFFVRSSPHPEQFYLGFYSLPTELKPDQTLQERFVIYAGPTSLAELSKLGAWAQETVYFGWTGGISKILLNSLIGLKKLTGNYGIAIMLMSFFITALFLPLSLISYNSMKRMKLLEPERAKLQEAYRDKPDKLHKETMGLFRKHKVNPLGGCLPFLFQMPIFIAFYQVLMRSFELKGAPFLFIRDLSLPDHAIHLPFSVGAVGNAINILPILTAGAMLIQQRLSGGLSAPTSGPEAETQKMMTKVMPLLFGFMFYGLPSGFILYWFTNTLLSIGTQRFFIRT